ncbi:MAG: hypothetical protein N2Z21_05540 [Candidatus Sumerlaeaceae bacterium]|nr:hypothetical protein [Candidatus Sumerlaeaceae bacterium]
MHVLRMFDVRQAATVAAILCTALSQHAPTVLMPASWRKITAVGSNRHKLQNGVNVEECASHLRMLRRYDFDTAHIKDEDRVVALAV